MLTKLDIINQMLAATGTAPLTTNDTTHPFYIKAESKLNIVTRTVQAQGWWFNRAKRTLNPDIAGEVILPSTTLSVDPVDTSSTFTQRGGKLYDPEDATFIIGVAVKVILIDEVEISDLPYEAADYIRGRAVYEFFRDEDGGGTKLRDYRDERDTAWIALKGANLRFSDLNVFNGTSFMQMQRGYRGHGLPVTDE